MRAFHSVSRLLTVLPFVLLLLAPVSGPASAAPLVAGMKPEEALRLGERMYRDGILPSGDPMQAMVKGDIPVDGASFTCTSCHLRSGIGVLEGRVFSPPITGAKLFAPLSRIERIQSPTRKDYASASISAPFRPAYTDETLAKVLRAGEDAAGRQINDVMPKYFLNDRDMEVLVHYLKQLSSLPEPGVTGESLRLATIIAGEVSPRDREAMLGALKAFVNRWNAKPPMQVRGVRQKPFVNPIMSQRYRKLELAVWELKGAPETWRTQLEDRQAAEPVFALIGGIAASGWEPIHRFCEDREIPAFFPLTDLPVVSEQDWYTMYLSKGLYQEGEGAARYLHSLRETLSAAPVVQVHGNDDAGASVARGFRETWVGLGNGSPVEIALNKGEQVTEAFWKRISEQQGSAIVLLWDKVSDLSSLGRAAAMKNGPRMVFLSSGLMGDRILELPEKARKLLYITYPRRLPEETRDSRAATEQWLKQNNLTSIEPDIESRVYSLATSLQGPLSMMLMRDYLYRDYLLERMDMMAGDSGTRTAVPGLSFGNGQRYASKGCYIVQLSEGPRPSLVKRSEWISH